MKHPIAFSHLIIVLFLFLPHFMQAQVGINSSNSDPDPSAMLDVQSTDKGVLMPRMTTAERDAIANPVAGLMIYNVEDSCFNYFTGKHWIKDCGRANGMDPQQASIGGAEGNERGTAISNDGAGNHYITGNFDNTANVGSFTLSSEGQTDAFIAKMDPNGEVLWATRFGGTSYDQGQAISTDIAGNSYVSGYFIGTATFGDPANPDTTLTSGSGFSTAVFIAKISPDGQLLWATRAGGGGFARAEGISLDDSGNSYFTGYFSGTTTFGDPNNPDTTITNGGVADLAMAKISPDGQFLWALNTGVTGGGGTVAGSSIYSDGAGNSFITGYFRGTATFGTTTLIGNGFYDIFVAKIGPSGQHIWASSVPGNTEDNRGFGITADAAGNSYITGVFSGTLTFGTTSLTSAGSADIFIAKMNPAGQFLWAIRAGGSSGDSGGDLTVDAMGNPYISGNFGGTATFGDPGNPDTTLTSTGNNDMFVAKMNPSGQFQWVRQAGGMFNEAASGISLDADGNCNITGWFEEKTSLGGTPLISTGLVDMFLWSVEGESGNNAMADLSLDDLQDGDRDPNNELQSLSLSGMELSLSCGNSVNLSSLNTDNQILSLSGTQLTISGGNSQDLSSLNTDNQSLSLSGTQLTISGGNTQDLASLKDNLGNHTATQSFALSGHWLSRDGTNTGLYIDASNQIGIGTSTPSRPLTIRGVNPISEIMALEDHTGTAKWHINFKDGGLNVAETLVADARLYLKEGGNVGIGTSTPKSDLDVQNESAEIRLTDPRSGSASFWNGGELLGRLGFYSLDPGPSNPSMVGSIDVVHDNGTTHPDGRMEFRTGTNGTAPVQMVLNSAGRVGIGTTTPQTLLDVEGTVSVSELEFPDGSSMTSAPPSTGIYVVSSGDFIMRQDDNDISFITGLSNGQGGTFLRSSSQDLIAPVHLPHGAVITKVTVYGYDLHSTNIVTSFRRSAFQSTLFYDISTQTSSTSSGTYTQSQTVNHTVDNSQNRYHVIVGLVGGTWHSAGELAINAVKIEYNMP
ncbi:MAG: SBBP repeat-containing protein [Bacteroidota bacterium]